MKRRSRKSSETVLYGLDPLIIRDPYEIVYRHSYAQDSPFFAGLTKGKLLGSHCPKCRVTYATPRSHCYRCGGATKWRAIPKQGTIHTYTTCYYGGEAFLDETPFILVLVAFEGVETLFLSRLIGARPEEVRIGMEVAARFSSTPSFRVTDVWFEPKARP
ncbi:MAG: Zn-ribbon domain-containing OB-fold protein [Nitrospirae bacterium]|nr:Zn-ribbon domain-containing OB-fold protein [Nitrospirota bacterium]